MAIQKHRRDDRRRRNSPPGFRWRRGRCRLRRGRRCRGRRCARPRRGRPRRRPVRARAPHPPRAGASCVARSACWRGGRRPGFRTEGVTARARARKAIVPTMASTIDDCDNPGGSPLLRCVGLAVEPAVERIDQAADPAHRMADRAQQALRIAETELDQHGDKCKRDGHERLHRRGRAAPAWRRSWRRPAPVPGRA